MQNEEQKNEEKKNEGKKESSEPFVKTDPETLHTTDPQEHMDGPMSSLGKAITGMLDGRDVDEDKVDDEEQRRNDAREEEES